MTSKENYLSRNAFVGWHYQIMNHDSPYHPQTTQVSIPTTQIPATGDYSMLIYCTVAITAIVKWCLPAVLGTGEIMTLGTWVEELVVVTILGFVCGLSKSHSIVYQPFVYYLVGYILPFPLIIRDKLFIVVYCFGVLACFAMYFGLFVGLVGRTVFEIACRHAGR